MQVYNFKNTPSKSQKKSGIFKIISKKLRKRNIRLGVLLFRTVAIGAVFLALLFVYYTRDLPDPNKLLNRQVAESTKIFDRNGELLYEIHGEAKRTLIGLDQVPDYAEKATIAIEDKDFYQHHGLYFRGILRSVFRYIINFGPEGGGGSTLTQQFVKNAILTNKKSFDRKIREAILSLAIEAKFSKDEILKLYLNEIPYGRNAYGIEAAAQSYFNKSAKDLTLAESAYLAALPQAPTFYNPTGPNRASLDVRKDKVLTAMRQQGYIDEKQEKEAKAEKVTFNKIKTGLLAPHFSLLVQDYLAKKYGEKALQTDGLKVYTTLDLKLQQMAEKAVKDGVEKNAKNYNAHNAALVAIDPKTGQVLAMVGSRDYFAESSPAGCTPGDNCLFEPNVNVSISQRQPGSSFKPYVYVTAFKPEFKMSPATMLTDIKTVFGKVNGKDYSPSNYDGKERGPVSIRSSLAGSLNIPAVKTLALTGVENAVQTARDLGITSPMADCGLALVLGGCEVRLLDHTAAYATLANRGEKNEKTFILKIEDAKGETLEEYKASSKKVLDEKAVYLLTSIMTDNNARTYVFGPNSPLILPDRPVAAKTGTTNNWGDGWTMGFTPSLAVGVWAGNNCGGGKCPMKRGADGVLVAAPIWNSFMKEALKEKPREDFVRPAGITDVTVDELSGKLPTANTPSTKTEVFADYGLPTEYDDVHITTTIDSQTGQLADENTPTERVVNKSVKILKSEMPGNPDWEKAVAEWATANGYVYGRAGFSFSPGPVTEQGELAINFIEPKDKTIVYSNPFKINLFVAGKNVVSKVEVFIDGQPAVNLYSLPFSAEISKLLSKGTHTLAAKATDISGKTATASIEAEFDQGPSLRLAEPGADSLVIFPLNLRAESAEKLNQVEFFYQKVNDEAKSLGKADNTANFSGIYEYSHTWSTSPESGEYYVFARSSSGLVSKKVKISIP